MGIIGRPTLLVKELHFKFVKRKTAFLDHDFEMESLFIPINLSTVGKLRKG